MEDFGSGERTWAALFWGGMETSMRDEVAQLLLLAGLLRHHVNLQWCKQSFWFLATECAVNTT